MASRDQDNSTTTQPALRAELDALNQELRKLKSTDFAVRAYVETWLATVGFLASAKLLFDWDRLNSKPPYIAIPVLSIAVLLAADSMVWRLKQRQLARVETRKLDRQRELRTQLGLDEAVFPDQKAA